MFRWVVVVSVALLELGCAEQLRLLDREPTAGISPSSFWPPPPSTTTWLVEAPVAAHRELLSVVAGELELRLRANGYSDQRWYPIGAGSSHGFAVTTRLEQVEGGVRSALGERWSATYPDAASLRWLEQARTPPLPGPGHYRVFLVSYTDLPIGKTANAPTWNEDTVMDWPNAAQRRTLRQANVPVQPTADFRFGVYEYEYERDGADTRGRFVPMGSAHSGIGRALPGLLGRDGSLIPNVGGSTD